MTKVMNPLARFFSSEGMLGKKERLGELDSTAKVYRSFFIVAWPAILESMLSALTGFVDTIMVGGIGDAAIAAVGLTNQPKLLFLSLYTTLNLGILAVVSRKKGEGKREEVNDCLHQGLSVCAILSVVIFALSYVIAEPLMVFAGAGDDVIGDSIDYYRIVMLGLCIYSFGLCTNAAQRGSSNTRIAFYTSATVNVSNVILNYLLIGGRFGFPALGVKGAAIATLIGNILGFIVAMASLYKKNGYLFFDFRRLFRFDKRCLSVIWQVSSGVAMEQLLIRIGFFIFAKLVAELGTESFAAHQIGMNIISICFASGDGLGVAASALVGQNLGKQRPDLAIIYGKAGQRVGLIFSALMFCVFTFFPYQIISLFTKTESVTELTRGIMYFISLTSIIQISQVIYSGCLRGAGDTKYMAAVSFFSIALFRPILCFIFCYPLGMDVVGAWVALFIDQSTRCVCASVRFIGGKWTKIKLG